MKKVFCKMVISCTLFLNLILPLGAQNDVGNIKCTLKGDVIDRPQSSQLLLLKQGEDPRINAVYIPINDGKFEYILNCEHEEQYELIFKDEFERGYMTPIQFFSEHNVINFTLHSTDDNRFDKNIVKGGNLNREYSDYFSHVSNMGNAVMSAYNKYLNDNYSEALNKYGLLNKDL